MKSKTTIFGWIARVITIAAILFVSSFALDAFEPGRTTLQMLAHFGMHLLPSLGLALVLLLAWRRELLGGIVVSLVAVVFAIMLFRLNLARTGSISEGLGIAAALALPFLVAGVLFIVSHLRSKNRSG